MTPAALAKLQDLSQAMQEADAAQLLSIKAEETRIRAQLAALDDHHKRTQSLTLMDAMPHRSLGGDIKWQVWVGRRRRELQIQLARCLARQGAARRALKKSFGKRAALSQIQTELLAHRARATGIKRDETVTGLGLLQRRQRQ
ncbi:MAG: hypothetical protein AAF231_05575 [Pseudomonadota bacterium]